MANYSEQAHKKLHTILDRYEKFKDDTEFRKNEKQICMSLIFPLFRDVLAWDTENPSEFKYEFVQSGKRMDCIVFLNGISQFVIEAKSLAKDITDNYEFYNQAIKYAHSKEKAFAVLTNFEKFIILRCDVQVDNPLQAEIGRVTAENLKDGKSGLLSYFEKGYWIENGRDNKLYSFLNIKRRQSVGEQLLEDLKKWRTSILRNLRKNEKRNRFDFENELEYIEEEVQRFIDRMIFICYCEDKELNEPILKSLLCDKKDRFWDKQGFLLGRIKKVFGDYDKQYNSDLFKRGYCDSFCLDDVIIAEIIQDLKQPARRLAYNFNDIEIDILGKAYENFIGHLLCGKKRYKERESEGKRKDEGIYYTPQYVVNFIIENTVREYIKNKQLHKIRVVDPACGSGSFLIQVYDTLSWSLKGRLKRELEYAEKRAILLNNIFGVDKDERACEIAKLNLSLKLAERGKKLPELHNNIRNGDSLIDDKNIAKSKAFDWHMQFQNIVENGIFDVVVGNPPYVFTRGKHFTEEEKAYFEKLYDRFGLKSLGHGKKRQTGKLNLFSLFLLKGISLLKQNGLLGFIIPNNLLRVTTYDAVRSFILDNCKIKTIVDLSSGVFKGVTASTIIIILEKEKNKELRDNNEIRIITDIKDLLTGKYKSHKIRQGHFYKNESCVFNIYATNEMIPILNKMRKGSVELGEISKEIIEGIVGSTERDVSDNKVDDSYRKFIVGKDIGKYKIDYRGKYIRYDRNLLHRARPEYVFTSPKIVIQRISGGSRPLTASFDDDKYYTFASVNNLLLNENAGFDIKYILALINSTLFNWYYIYSFTNKSELTVNVSKTFLDVLPIKKIRISEQKIFVKLVDVVLLLNKKLGVIGDKITDEKYQIQKEIKQTEKKIDELVYRVYGITIKEKEIIEKNME